MACAEAGMGFAFPEGICFDFLHKFLSGKSHTGTFMNPKEMKILPVNAARPPQRLWQACLAIHKIKLYR
jgi:hypothetical protein